MKVWVVMVIDEAPMAVFSTKEQADALADACEREIPRREGFSPGYFRPYVIEYELDEQPSE